MKQPATSNHVLVLQGALFEATMRDEGVLLMILSITASPYPPKLVSKPFVDFLSEYADVFPEGLPSGLPPLHEIKHHIHLVHDATLSNRPRYRMSPSEYEELQNQVEDLVSIGFLRERLSLYKPVCGSYCT